MSGTTHHGQLDTQGVDAPTAENERVSENPDSSTVDSADAGSSQDTERAGALRDGLAGNALPESLHAEPSAGKSQGRWWLAVAVGMLISLPFAWLLSYAATLPFFIGLFFFVLFGLIIGATMHRTAAPGRPYARPVLLTGTSIVILFGWTVALANESHDFPSDMADYAVGKARDIGDRTVDEYHAAVAGQVREHLRSSYAPGGTIGYVRWALTSGEIRAGELQDVKIKLGQSQRRYSWAIRVVLSLVLLSFGIGSQTLPLRLVKERALRAIDDV